MMRIRHDQRAGHAGVTFVLLLIAFCAIGHASAADLAGDVARRSCAALTARVDAVAGAAPVLLRSYDSVRDADPDEPPLRTAAFSYDNALAVIALLGCDQRAQALRVGEALRMAALSGTRLRNVYRAGAIGKEVLPNGWWDAKKGRWFEDAYQQGSATGNVAWVALALLALHDVTHDARWLEAARHLAQWCVDNVADSRGAGGFSGGIEGFDKNPRRIAWKSTEHNIDLVALFARLAAAAPDAQERARWRDAQATARRFVDSAWDAPSGHFVVGTTVDGATANRAMSALDVQLWAQLLPDAPAAWRRALAYVEREHAVAGGFDFNADRDGLWLEGTAQAALVYRLAGDEARAQALFATIAAQSGPDGLVYATREPRITTGLGISSDSKSDDFHYYRRPHVGATAWAALAALRVNPFAAR